MTDQAVTALLGGAPDARRRLSLAIAAGVAGAVAVIAAAWVMAMVVTGVVEGRLTLATSAPLLALLGLLATLRAGTTWLGEALAQDASNRLRRRLRQTLAERIVALGPAWTAVERSGELVAVATGGLDAVDALVTSYLPARALAMLVPALILLVVLALDPPTTLVLILTGPVLVVLLALIGSRAGELTRRRFLELRWMRALFLDMLQGLPTLKAFGRSAEQAETIRAVSRRYGETTLEVLRTAFQTALVLEWGGAVAMALVAVEISLRLMGGTLAFERALAVLIVTPEFFLPLRQLAIRYHAGTAGAAAAERIGVVLAANEEPDAAVSVAAQVPEAAQVRAAARVPAAANVPEVVGAPPDVVFEGLTVRYPGVEKAALDDLTLRLPAGRMTAIVGTTGAGKTTLVRVLLRFIEPADGGVSVGDRTTGDPDLASWRAGIAWVPQSPHRFHGSVADRLRLGRPNATAEELERALRLAAADAFVRRLPDGLDTRVGEGGLRLSGGEHQRLAIARALLRDAPLLLLDEPTAHLDPATEARVLDALRSLTPDHTVLVVAHRLRVAAAADLVVVLEAGRVVEVGPPDELTRRDGPFRRLVEAWGPDDEAVT